jgi:hypothetical protein
MKLSARRGDNFAVRLHNTDVLTFKGNGDIVLDTDGWRTVTTKQRMNEFQNVAMVWSERGVWYVTLGHNGWNHENAIPYADGITLHSDGMVSGVGDEPDNRVRKRISQYVAGYIAAMESGKVPAPDNGDCFYCSMRDMSTHRPLGEVTSNTDHLDSHIKEKYYVPSLLARAIEVFPVSQVMKWWIGSCWDTQARDEERSTARHASGDWAKKQVAKVLRRYIMRQYGFQA